jgi:hypothetical protein
MRIVLDRIFHIAFIRPRVGGIRLAYRLKLVATDNGNITICRKCSTLTLRIAKIISVTKTSGQLVGQIGTRRQNLCFEHELKKPNQWVSIRIVKNNAHHNASNYGNSLHYRVKTWCKIDIEQA